jgi:nicotinate-nucleotide adenylyltransferase
VREGSENFGGFNGALLASTVFYFGTFNPLHWGHWLLAQSVVSQGGFERLVFVPTGLPPNKQQQGDLLLPIAERIALIETAITAMGMGSVFSVSDVEAVMERPSYTGNTLAQLVGRPLATLSKGSVSLVMGQDTAETFDTWFDTETLQQVCRLWVAPRGDRRDSERDRLLEALAQRLPDTTIERLQFPAMGVSSSWLNGLASRGLWSVAAPWLLPATFLLWQQKVER